LNDAHPRVAEGKEGLKRNERVVDSLASNTLHSSSRIMICERASKNGKHVATKETKETLALDNLND
jgi:hypothetical protein